MSPAQSSCCKSIPRVAIKPEILGLLGPTRHRNSIIFLRNIEVFGYGAPASGSEAALGALTCSGWASGGVPGLILDSPGGRLSFWERFVGTQSPFGAPVFGLRRLKCFSDNPELSFSSSFPSERSFMNLWKGNLY